MASASESDREGDGTAAAAAAGSGGSSSEKRLEGLKGSLAGRTPTVASVSDENNLLRTYRILGQLQSYVWLNLQVEAYMLLDMGRWAVGAMHVFLLLNWSVFLWLPTFMCLIVDFCLRI